MVDIDQDGVNPTAHAQAWVNPHRAARSIGVGVLCLVCGLQSANVRGLRSDRLRDTCIVA